MEKAERKKLASCEDCKNHCKDIVALITHRMDNLENTLEEHVAESQNEKVQRRQETMTMVLAALSTIASTLTAILKILKS